jgi:protein-S-isoprenylcysteine O-methyltransferase Ste14
MRNPIYTGMVLGIAGGVLVAPTAIGAVACALVALGVAVQARLEERHLLSLHGDAYRLYASETGRFLPGVGLLEDARGVSAPAPR